MSDDAELRRQVAAVADVAASTKASVESLRNQTEDQWRQIRQVQDNSIRQTAMLDQVVKDQNKLAETISKVEDGVSEYKSDKKVFSAFKWVAGIGGGAGFIAAVKTFLGIMPPPGGAG